MKTETYFFKRQRNGFILLPFILIEKSYQEMGYDYIEVNAGWILWHVVFTIKW